MRRILLALFALVAFGAAAPLADIPTVVVFPLQASASLDGDVTSRIVTLLANQIAIDGRVHIAPADPTVQRVDFLTAARKAGAQYYVTGFITPLGDGASIIEQVVSTQSGTIVFSNSGQITSLKDVDAQGDILRAGILERASHATYGFSAPSAPSGGGPGPGPTPARTNATEPPEATLGGLFHHKKAAGPVAPSPSPAASPSPAS